MSKAKKSDAAAEKATAPGFNPYRIPRVPIRRSDGWLFFRAKTRGWLAREEAMYGRLTQLRRKLQTVTA